MPDEMAVDFTHVTPDYLISRNIRFIFSDIDNTLATYDDPLPPENVVKWCRDMNEAGISVAFVSNNNEERVRLFNRDFGYIAYAKARKPRTGALKAAMKDAGASPSESLLLGDQLLTDAAAGRLAGLHVIIVPPIKDKTTLFFRFKRKIEAPYVRKFLKGRKMI